MVVRTPRTAGDSELASPRIFFRAEGQLVTMRPATQRLTSGRFAQTAALEWRRAMYVGLYSHLLEGLTCGLSEIETATSCVSKKDVLADGDFARVLKVRKHGVLLVAKIISTAQRTSVMSAPPSAIEVLHEAILMTRLNHACIIKLFNVSWMNTSAQPSSYVLLVEYCAGGTVSTLLYEKDAQDERHPRTPNPIDDSLFIQIVRELLSALVYLKESRVVHRDLKPSNLGLERPPNPIELRGDRPILRIMDFGISRVLTSGNERKTSGLGSGYYLAPEVLSSYDDYAFGADLYSAALIFNEMRTQVVPFRPASLAEARFDLIDRIASGEARPDLEHKCPPCLKLLIESCWHSNPRHRWQVEEAQQFMLAHSNVLLDPSYVLSTKWAPLPAPGRVSSIADRDTSDADAAPNRTTKQASLRPFKVVVLGRHGVGKTSFIRRLANPEFKDGLGETAPPATIGFGISEVQCDVGDGELATLQLWDTAGQERFRSAVPSVLRKVDAVIFVYDVCDPDSIIDRNVISGAEVSASAQAAALAAGTVALPSDDFPLPYYFNRLMTYSPDRQPAIFMVGNKQDVEGTYTDREAVRQSANLFEDGVTALKCGLDIACRWDQVSTATDSAARFERIRTAIALHAIEARQRQRFRQPEVEGPNITIRPAETQRDGVFSKCCAQG